MTLTNVLNAVFIQNKRIESFPNNKMFWCGHSERGRYWGELEVWLTESMSDGYAAVNVNTFSPISSFT